MFRTEGIRTIQTPVRAPNANAFTERWIGTLRGECLDRLLVAHRRHRERVLPVYIAHYNTHRPHRCLQQRPPTGCPEQDSATVSLSTGFDAETYSVGSLRRLRRPSRSGRCSGCASCSPRGARAGDSATSSGRPWLATDIEESDFYRAFPERAEKEEQGSPLVLVRLPKTRLALPPRARGLRRRRNCRLLEDLHARRLRDRARLVCPGHYSTFDPARGGKVLFGPAGRPLPMLPLAIDAKGYLRARGARYDDLVAALELVAVAERSHWVSRQSRFHRAGVIQTRPSKTRLLTVGERATAAVLPQSVVRSRA